MSYMSRIQKFLASLNVYQKCDIDKLPNNKDHGDIIQTFRFVNKFYNLIVKCPIIANHIETSKPVMWQTLSVYFQHEGVELVEWAKCGEGYTSVTPTLLWAVGTAALTQRLLTALFRRFIFRRVPLWELVLQNLLFIWMVIYSLHFWLVLVKIIKVFVEYCCEDVTMLDFQSQKPLISTNGLASRRAIQQWVIWFFGMAPLAVYIHTRPRAESPPLMIWITTSPWLRREMGPYGYYLNRPLSPVTSDHTLSQRQHALNLRKAFSDSNIHIKEPPKRKRHSKSV